MQNKTHELRIIGGQWRRRKLSFTSQAEVRPTTDFIRETLFNWLAPFIENRTCLDLFAGSGALGFEALSRGAKHVSFADSSSHVIQSLQQNATMLAATNVDFHCLNFSVAAPNPFMRKFDLVFLDPPFKQGLIAPACQWLEDNKLLADDALIYLETERKLKPLLVPDTWELYRQKTSGQVNYYLYSKGTL